MRLLFEVADPSALGDPALADVILVDAAHDPQQGGLARAVDAKHADLGVRVERQMDVVQNLPVRRIGLGQTLHVIDELTGHSALPFRNVGKLGADVAIARQKGKRSIGGATAMLELAIYVLLTLAAGACVVTQQALNANLRGALDSAAWAGVISYAAGLLCVIALVLMTREPPSLHGSDQSCPALGLDRRHLRRALHHWRD